MIKETNANTYTVEQTMQADDDTLIITDPCYIMKDSHWNQWLDMAFSRNPMELDVYLKEYHNFGEVIAADTGYGDWNNEVLDSNGEAMGEFSADAGMVIVCTASDLTNYGYDKEEIERLQENGCLTIIPNYTGTVELHYEYNDEGSKLAVLYGMSESCGDFNTLGWNSSYQ